MSTVHVGATQEIWDAINVDLQQIVDDVSCWEGRHAERMCERLSTAIVRLNAAVEHEREGYEAAIASAGRLDELARQVETLQAALKGTSMSSPTPAERQDRWDRLGGLHMP